MVQDTWRASEIYTEVSNSDFRQLSESTSVFLHCNNRCLGRFIESSPRKWGIMGATLEIQRSQQLEAYEQQYIRQQVNSRGTDTNKQLLSDISREQLTPLGFTKLSLQSQLGFCTAVHLTIRKRGKFLSQGTSQPSPWFLSFRLWLLEDHGRSLIQCNHDFHFGRYVNEQTLHHTLYNILNRNLGHLSVTFFL